MYDLGSVYEPQMVGLQLRIHQLDHLMRRYLPKLHAHLDAVGIFPEAFSSVWFTTLWTRDDTLSLAEHVKVIDEFLRHGWVFLFQLAMGILDELRLELLQVNDPSVISNILKQLGRHIRVQDFTTLAASYQLRFSIPAFREMNPYVLLRKAQNRLKRENWAEVRLITSDDLEELEDTFVPTV